ncbi:hypothetical protein [Leptolyngbya iicbica]|nr:hypothetical protein [Leptolyngbya sp. LK]
MQGAERFFVGFGRQSSGLWGRRSLISTGNQQNPLRFMAEVEDIALELIFQEMLPSLIFCKAIATIAKG